MLGAGQVGSRGGEVGDMPCILIPFVDSGQEIRGGPSIRGDIVYVLGELKCPKAGLGDLSAIDPDLVDWLLGGEVSLSPLAVSSWHPLLFSSSWKLSRLPIPPAFLF